MKGTKKLKESIQQILGLRLMTKSPKIIKDKKKYTRKKKHKEEY